MRYPRWKLLPLCCSWSQPLCHCCFLMGFQPTDYEYWMQPLIRNTDKRYSVFFMSWLCLHYKHNAPLYLGINYLNKITTTYYNLLIRKHCKHAQTTLRAGFPLNLKKYLVCIFAEKHLMNVPLGQTFFLFFQTAFRSSLGTNYMQNLNATYNYHKTDNKRGEEMWTFTVRRQDDICLGACRMPKGNMPTCSNTQDSERVRMKPEHKPQVISWNKTGKQ